MEIVRKYWETGELMHEYYLLNGLLHGPSHKWMANGLLIEISNYNKGKACGKFIQFRENGTIECCGTALDDDVFDGVHEQWAVNHWDNKPYVVRQVFRDGIRELIYSTF